MCDRKNSRIRTWKEIREVQGNAGSYWLRGITVGETLGLMDGCCCQKEGRTEPSILGSEFLRSLMRQEGLVFLFPWRQWILRVRQLNVDSAGISVYLWPVPVHRDLLERKANKDGWWGVGNLYSLDWLMGTDWCGEGTDYSRLCRFQRPGVRD